MKKELLLLHGYWAQILSGNEMHTSRWNRLQKRGDVFIARWGSVASNPESEELAERLALPLLAVDLGQDF